jgi:DNA-binding NtrC family response regulator
MSETTAGLDLLLVDDETDFLEPAYRFFERLGYHVAAAADAEQALAIHVQRRFDVAVIDQHMPGIDGLELLRRLLGEDPEMQVILLTGGGTIASAVEAIKHGAADYLIKPLRLPDLDVLIRKAHRAGQLQRENQNLREALARYQPPSNIVGEAPAMKELLRLIDRVAASDKPVLIEGESGTGKELVARAIHAASPLADQPLVVINCAALPESLLESELFGHERGAFTGAVAAKPGLFEIADGGTLLIDEFGELAGSLQAKLLRVLEDGSLRRVGSVKERRVRVRILAATNRDLAGEVRGGRFREDLYYRVNVLTLLLPPLRQRDGDIPLLVRHLLGEQWELEPGVMELLDSYAWPGNVRQLQNALERAKILTQDQVIRRENLPPEVQGLQPGAVFSGNAQRSVSRHLLVETAGRPAEFELMPSEPVDLEALNRKHVLAALERSRGNKAEAARRLGVGRRTLYRMLEKYDQGRECQE